MLDKIKAAEKVYRLFLKDEVRHACSVTLIKQKRIKLIMGSFIDYKGSIIPVIFFSYPKNDSTLFKAKRILTFNQMKKLILAFRGEEELNDYLYKVHNDNV